MRRNSKKLGLVKAQMREPSPFPFRGKRAENRSHNLGKLLGEGWGHKFSDRRMDVKTERRKDGKTERRKDRVCL